MKFELVTARYFRRFTTSLVDIGIVSLIALGLVFALVERGASGNFEFISPLYFYLWCVLLIGLFFFFNIALPLLTRGRTIGMYFTQTKIEHEGKLFLALFRRDLFFGVAWSFLVVLAMGLINHTLAATFARPGQVNVDYSDWERLRIGIVATAGGFIVIFQFYCAAGVIARNDHRGFHDRLSRTRTVVTFKWKASEFSRIVYIPPRLVHNEVVEWVSDR